jgi:hypothetical protein
MPLTAEQIKRLLTPVRGDRIVQKQGNSYVPTHEVKAELSRVFGPGNWDHTIHDLRLLWETEFYDEAKKKTFYRACYLCACTLRIRDYEGNQIAQVTEYHAEANSNLPDRGEAHAMAVTSVESYALRRAALDLGDAFGLHLYADGQLAPLVRGSLIFTDQESPLFSPPEPPTEKQQSALQHSVGAQLQGAINTLQQGLGASPVNEEANA